MNTTREERKLSTADFAAVTDPPPARETESRDTVSAADESVAQRTQEPHDNEQLAALFAPEMADDLRARWDDVQIGFVDDPRQAVRKADELVAQVIQNLAQTFSNERSRLENELQQTEQGSTESLRVALRRYRSFFQRLLSL